MPRILFLTTAILLAVTTYSQSPAPLTGAWAGTIMGIKDRKSVV